MTDLMETVRSWPDEQQDEAAQILLAVGRLGSGGYRASDVELQAVDEALAQIEGGAHASQAEIEAAYARFRR